LVSSPRRKLDCEFSRGEDFRRLALRESMARSVYGSGQQAAQQPASCRQQAVGRIIQRSVVRGFGCSVVPRTLRTQAGQRTQWTTRRRSVGRWFGRSSDSITQETQWTQGTSGSSGQDYTTFGGSRVRLFGYSPDSIDQKERRERNPFPPFQLDPPGRLTISAFAGVARRPQSRRGQSRGGRACRVQVRGRWDLASLFRTGS